MEEAKNICNNFLTDLDGFLRDNLDNLTCSDINNIYSNFYEDLKDYKGNANGFTGLSEFIIFRFILNMLGGSFDKKQETTYLYSFESKDKKYRIGENLPVFIGSKKYVPDITIYKNDVPILVIEIKLYLTNGIKTLMDDINKLNSITSEYPDTKGLFICYNKIPEKGKIYKRLTEETNSNNKLDYIILNENSLLFKDSLKKHI